MTSTNVVVTNLIDYTTQLNNIGTQLSLLNNYLAILTGQPGYFDTNNRVEKVISKGTWSGVTSTIYLTRPIPVENINTNYRIEGNNIDIDTFITSYTTTTIGTLTYVTSVVLDKPTLGLSPTTNRQLRFFET